MDIQTLINDAIDSALNPQTNDMTTPSEMPASGEEKYTKQEPGGVMNAVNISELLDKFDKIDESSFRVYNDTLCPLLWDDYKHLDPRVRVNLLRMAYDFYEKTKFSAPIVDVYLMGSAANFNWTPDSDADIHVVIDYKKLQMPPETLKNAVKTAGAMWNNEHKVWAKGHKVEINIQDVNEVKPYVTGIYSLVHDKWIRMPSYQNIQIDKAAIHEKYAAMKQYIQSVIDSKNPELMKQAKKYIDAFRQYGLDTVGELSVENIVFKILRKRGIIKTLKDSITSTYDKEMTVQEDIPWKDNNVEFENINEVTQADINSRHPSPDALYRTKSGKPIAGNFDYSKLTLSNLKSLRTKEAAAIKWLAKYENPAYVRIAKEQFKMLDAEIKRRLNYINAPVAEGYGAGIPEQDRLHIPGERWRIKSKNAPKTPKMPTEDKEFIENFVEQLLMESPDLDKLKKYRKTLTDDERTIVISNGATWSDNKPGVWKSVIDGKTWYVCNTHRAYQCKPTLKGAIKAFEFIKTTS